MKQEAMNEGHDGSALRHGHHMDTARKVRLVNRLVLLNFLDYSVLDLTIPVFVGGRGTAGET